MKVRTTTAKKSRKCTLDKALDTLDKYRFSDYHKIKDFFMWPCEIEDLGVDEEDCDYCVSNLYKKDKPITNEDDLHTYDRVYISIAPKNTYIIGFEFKERTTVYYDMTKEEYHTMVRFITDREFDDSAELVAYNRKLREEWLRKNGINNE